MFRDRDLALRLTAAALPPRLGYRATLRLTPRLASEAAAWVGSRVRDAAARVCPPEVAELAGARFVPHLACDDLDVVTSALWPAALRRRAVRVEGADAMPPPGRALLVSFHLSGGFRIFDVLDGLGFRPGLIAAVGPPTTRYARVVAAARDAYWRRNMPSSIYLVGDVPRGAVRTPAAHLRDGGALVVLLDVPIAGLGVRDVVRCGFLDGTIEIPAGTLRLAVRARVPIVVFDSRLEDGRRVIRLHPPIVADDVERAANAIVTRLDGIIRERPWDWHGWLGREP